MSIEKVFIILLSTNLVNFDFYSY